MMDDNEEDESDNGAIHSQRKTPIIFSVHNYLPHFSHEPTNADIVCPLFISSTEGADD
jgi:hypothetical protein